LTTERPEIERESGRTGVGDSLVEGVITDEAVANARNMIGVILRPEGPYLQDATLDTIRNFSNGIGDVNPLYRDAEYGRRSRYSSVLAHPMFPYAFGWPGRSRWGLPGVHGFYAGNDWEFVRNVRPGDRISCLEQVVGVEEKDGAFSGRLVIQYVEASYFNQRDELVARVLGWTTRHERRAARERGKYSKDETADYTNEELRSIDDAVLSEVTGIRGSSPRYFEDVDEGEALPDLVRGPLSLMDTMGFLVGCGRGHTHGILRASVGRHPEHYFRNPESGGGIEYTGIGHHRDSTAKQVGVPGTYDYGPQRTAWLCSLVTNWMGDAGIIKRLRADLRRFNVVGDTTWCRGKVLRKYQFAGQRLLDLEIWTENQRQELTTRGLATVVLPSRNTDVAVVMDGSSVDLQLPKIR
jgi:acyl dehydratase